MEPKKYLSLVESQKKAAGDPKKQGVIGFGKLKATMSPVTRDNTSVAINSIDPLTRAAVDYYNPPVKEGISSGNAAMDALYRNQWIFRVPVVGKAISNAAYNVATQSQGDPTVGGK